MLFQGTDSVLEVFCILSQEEIQKKMDKKLKKARKKAKYVFLSVNNEVILGRSHINGENCSFFKERVLILITVKV